MFLFKDASGWNLTSGSGFIHSIDCKMTTLRNIPISILFSISAPCRLMLVHVRSASNGKIYIPRKAGKSVLGVQWFNYLFLKLPTRENSVAPVSCLNLVIVKSILHIIIPIIWELVLCKHCCKLIEVSYIPFIYENHSEKWKVNQRAKSKEDIDLKEVRSYYRVHFD